MVCRPVPDAITYTTDGVMEPYLIIPVAIGYLGTEGMHTLKFLNVSTSQISFRLLLKIFSGSKVKSRCIQTFQLV